jgi:hypothetical protein
MLSKESISQIEATPADQGWRANRVQIFDLPEGKVIVKGQRAVRPPWRHLVLTGLSRLIRLPCARAVPVHGGERSQAIELQRLKALADSACKVPSVLHVGKDYFVMPYLGLHNGSAAITQPDTRLALLAWQQAMLYFIDIHAKGQYLSQAFARNLLQTADGFVAIDFEDDPLEVMPLVDAQVRDCLLLLSSTVWHVNVSDDVKDDLIDRMLAVESRPVRLGLLQAAKRLSIFRHLPTKRRPWGKDVVQLQAVAAALHRYYLRTSIRAI